MTISVIIPTWNEAERIGAGLRHTRATAAGADRELIVVDGGSADGTRARAEPVAGRILPAPVITSARRYEAAGWWRQTLRHKLVLALFQLGAAPPTLTRWRG